MRCQRLRASGVGSRPRPSGEPSMAPATGTVSLSGMARAVWGELALLGTESRAGTGLPAVDLARLEDAGSRCLDWLERRAAATQSAIDHQQQSVFGSAMGTGQRASQ